MGAIGTDLWTRISTRSDYCFAIRRELVFQRSNRHSNCGLGITMNVVWADSKVLSFQETTKAI